MMRILVFTKRNFKEAIRDPLSTMFCIAFPLVLLLMFSTLSKFEGATQFKIINFAPGIAVFSFSFDMLYVSLLVSQDRSSSFLTRLTSSPLTASEFIAGYILTLIPIAIFQSVFFFLVATIMDTSIFSINLLYAMLALIPMSLLFIAIGLLFGTIFNEKAVGGFTSLVTSAMSIFSGMWFPLDAFETAKTFDIITKVLPFRHEVDLIRMILIGDYSGVDLVDNVLIPIGVIFIYTVVFFVLAITVFKSKMRNDRI